MRVIAIDYGDQRTGIAVSDPTGTIAGEAFVIKEWDPERLADKIAAECEERGAERVVLGNPLNMDGSAGPRSDKSRALRELLAERINIPIIMWDERRTTVEAHDILSANDRHGKRRKETVDAVAATLILEGDLGSIK